MKADLLGIQFDALDLAGMVELINGYLDRKQPCHVITANPELLYNAQFDPQLLELVRQADVITADGVGVVWASQRAGCPVPERVTGIDLLVSLAEGAARENRSVFLLGAAPGIAEEAAEKLCRDFPGLRLAGVCDGYFTEDEENAVVEQVRAAKPDLLFVALGAPKQEWWINRYLPVLGPVTAIGVGGSFDVISGRVLRAPVWVQRMRCEWLYRLLKDPGRWRRQTVLPRFAWLVIKKYK
ncbi:MAG: WecB/TagA/CpsF family glycosyltransferase [Peptococcaceae bacterium]|nr:WecB/TagA/CpsF family glycosyltransferase [Peptococcaceae bacterium]